MNKLIRERILDFEDVQVNLEELGIKITEKTLLDYEILHLIPKPLRVVGETGEIVTRYHIDTVCEVYAGWSLLHGKYAMDSKGLFMSELSKVSVDGTYYARMCYFADWYEDIIDKGLEYQTFIELIENETLAFRNETDPININDFIDIVRDRHQGDTVDSSLRFCMSLYKNEINIALGKLKEIGFY